MIFIASRKHGKEKNSGCLFNCFNREYHSQLHVIMSPNVDLYMKGREKMTQPIILTNRSNPLIDFT